MNTKWSPEQKERKRVCPFQGDADRTSRPVRLEADPGPQTSRNPKKNKKPLNDTLKSSIVLLIKYTVLEQMSRKISQINFSFIQHLWVGNDLYIMD